MVQECIVEGTEIKQILNTDLFKCLCISNYSFQDMETYKVQ